MQLILAPAKDGLCNVLQAEPPVRHEPHASIAWNRKTRTLQLRKQLSPSGASLCSLVHAFVLATQVRCQNHRAAAITNHFAQRQAGESLSITASFAKVADGSLAFLRTVSHLDRMLLKIQRWISRRTHPTSAMSDATPSKSRNPAQNG
eukprot:5263000-Amphidinium_carterae.1